MNITKFTYFFVQSFPYFSVRIIRSAEGTGRSKAVQFLIHVCAMTFQGAPDRITTVTMYTAKQRILDLDVLSTLPELLTHHLDKRPDAVAYKFYDQKAKAWLEKSFKETFEDVLAWRKSFAAYPFLERGDRCAMLLPNCYEAVCFDQSVLANALVPVPLHAIDTPKSSGFILRDSGAKVLVTNKLLKWKLITCRWAPRETTSPPSSTRRARPGTPRA